MKCHRCSSVTVYEIFFGPDEPFSGWRCVQCGEILDEVIMESRQAGISRVGGEAENRERVGYQ